MIFDTHTHYDDSRYDGDREEVLSSLSSHNIKRVVNVSAEMQDLDAVIELSRRYDFLYAALGVHPDYTGDLTESDMETIRTYVQKFGHHAGTPEGDFSERKVVAIGEIGLDYHGESVDPAIQKKWFRAQIEIARDFSLPFIVHSRDAAKDTLDLLSDYTIPEGGGVVHCYSYEEDLAKTFIKMGYYIGVGGVVTFKNGRKLKETVAEIPLEKILLETDCPYLSPEPFRGERNDSTRLSYVVSAIADIKNETEEKVMQVTYENACRFYHI